MENNKIHKQKTIRIRTQRTFEQSLPSSAKLSIIHCRFGLFTLETIREWKTPKESKLRIYAGLAEYKSLSS